MVGIITKIARRVESKKRWTIHFKKTRNTQRSIFNFQVMFNRETFNIQGGERSISFWCELAFTFLKPGLFKIQGAWNIVGGMTSHNEHFIKIGHRLLSSCSGVGRYEYGDCEALKKYTSRR
jgi:hypothetical protein